MNRTQWTEEPLTTVVFITITSWAGRGSHLAKLKRRKPAYWAYYNQWKITHDTNNHSDWNLNRVKTTSLVRINCVGLTKRNAVLRSRDIQQQRVTLVFYNKFLRGRRLRKLRFGDEWHAQTLFRFTPLKMRVSMGCWLLRLSLNIRFFLRLTVNLVSLRLTEILEIRNH